MLARGCGFWLKGTGGRLDPTTAHLFCALTNPCENGQQLIANITSVRSHGYQDQTCILKPGDHDDIDRLSCIAYEHARTINKAIIEAAKFGRAMRLTSEFPDDVRLRIGEGMLVSDHVTPKLQAYWRDNRDR